MKQRNPLLSLVIEMSTVTVLALVITVVLRLFVAEAFYVPSESMYNTLTTNDRILAEKISYMHRDVDRGDIVVFKDPGNWLNEEQVEPGPFRRAKLYYLRELRGKAAKIKEKREVVTR